MSAASRLPGIVDRVADTRTRTHWLISVAALIAYFPLFLLLQPLIGNVALAVAFMPVLIWATLLTPRIAFLGSLLLAIPNYFLLHSIRAMQTPQEDIQLFISHLTIGLLSYVVGYSYQLRRNIADQLAARQKSDARFRGLFEHTNDAVFILTPDLRIVDVNEQGAQILGYSPRDLAGIDYHKLVVAEESDEVEDRLQQVLAGILLPLYERSLRKKDGSTVTVEVNAAAIFDARGKLDHIQSICRDITERKAAEEKLFYQASHDELTGLFNRAMFFSHLSQAVNYQGRQDQRLGVLFLDLDGFKKVNDTHGHAAGDLLLKQTAERLRSRLRKSDIIARMGGDEFAVILPTLTDEKYADHVVKAIEEVLNAPFDLDGKTVKISASVGVGMFPRDALDAETLVKIADQAMYEIKQKRHLAGNK
jgi:diguanylate cyclase (GGDEF)-like protein/PAS domain S-box-containing protein